MTSREQLTDNENTAIEIAVHAGKMSVMHVWDDIAEALQITPNAAKELLDNLVRRGVLRETGEGARNVGEDPNGQSKPVAWYSRW